jgi:hypothetical protein
MPSSTFPQSLNEKTLVAARSLFRALNGTAGHSPRSVHFSPVQPSISAATITATASLSCAFAATPETEPAGTHDVWVPAGLAAKAGAHTLTCGEA